MWGVNVGHCLSLHLSVIHFFSTKSVVIWYDLENCRYFAIFSSIKFSLLFWRVQMRPLCPLQDFSGSDWFFYTHGVHVTLLCRDTSDWFSSVNPVVSKLNLFGQTSSCLCANQTFLQLPVPSTSQHQRIVQQAGFNHLFTQINGSLSGLSSRGDSKVQDIWLPTLILELTHSFRKSHDR